MREYSLDHLSDGTLLRDLTALIIRERRNTAAILAHIAEVDARKLYVPAGYASMFAYCVEEFHFSEDAAYRQIQAARAAREFPQILTAIANGCLHLTAVTLLAPHLTQENADELIKAASRRPKRAIEDMLARLQTPAQPEGLLPFSQLAPAQVGQPLTFDNHRSEDTPMVSVPLQLAAANIEKREVLVQVTVRESTRDKIKYAQSLLSHALPSGDVSVVLERALDLLIERIEKKKIGAGKRSTHSAQPRVDSRHVPANVRCAVWKRDGGQCTFVSADGKRCGSHRFLEFDHVTPVARGGQATVEGIRLRCRAHNQFEAEQVFGVEFMQKKRARSQVNHDVFSALRNLGARSDEARKAAEYATGLGDVPLEERVRMALKYLYAPRAG